MPAPAPVPVPVPGPSSYVPVQVMPMCRVSFFAAYFEWFLFNSVLLAEADYCAYTLFMDDLYSHCLYLTMQSFCTV
jgi:hypothetical protein